MIGAGALSALVVLLVPAAGAAADRPAERIGPGHVASAVAGLQETDTLPEPGRLVRPPSERRGLDVLHYRLELDLRQLAARQLRGRARLRLRTTRPLESVPLDLVALEVDSASLDGRAATVRHRHGLLELGPRTAGDTEGATVAAGEHVVTVTYHGRTREGLFFGADARGDTTVFADNWPNRARWWFPSNDHPSDKATVRFDVRVPTGWEVVANGARVGTADSGPDASPSANAPSGARAGGDGAGAGEGSTWSWETRAPIPTYTMVVGAAKFGEFSIGDAACGRAPHAPGRCVDVSVWPLAGDSAFAVDRFRRAPDMVDYYTGLFGPFPYAKLAHVESATRFGGMENAGAIFYARRPWTEGTMGEGVIAHETVHQWFGDAVTPARWRHLWLSEGFATYFAAVYFGARDGPAAMRSRLAEARAAYLRSDVTGRAVVDTTRDLYALLNPNSYQKGAWVLHTLRGVVGDSAFFRGARRYYRRHRHATAATADLRRAMEATSGRELGWFFDQWLRRPGYPRLDVEWWTESAAAATGREVVLAVRQTQPVAWPAFRIPMEVEIRRPDGEPRRRSVTVSGRSDTLRLSTEGEIREIVLDPDGEVLMRADVRRRALQPAASGASGRIGGSSATAPADRAATAPGGSGRGGLLPHLSLQPGDDRPHAP